MASIVVYDSGVGGLTVYQEIVQRCTDNDIVFVSDNDAFPYGTKTEKELVERVVAVVERISHQYSPDVLVIACNSASTVVLPVLRDRFDFDVVGVVPAIKPAAHVSNTKRICLLATPGTVARRYTDELISGFASDCDVIKIGSTELVQLAEQKLRGKALDISQISAIIKPVIDDVCIDVIVLACTHFPLLNKEIERVLNINHREVILIDSGAAIAQRVSFLLEKYITTDITPGQRPAGMRIAVFTKELEDEALISNLDTYCFTEIHRLVV